MRVRERFRDARLLIPPGIAFRYASSSRTLLIARRRSGVWIGAGVCTRVHVGRRSGIDLGWWRSGGIRFRGWNWIWCWRYGIGCRWDRIGCGRWDRIGRRWWHRIGRRWRRRRRARSRWGCWLRCAAGGRGLSRCGGRFRLRCRLRCGIAKRRSCGATCEDEKERERDKTKRRGTLHHHGAGWVR